MPTTPTAARTQVLFAAFLFSVGGVAIKSTTLGGFEVAGLRSIVAALVLFVAVPRARRGVSLAVVPTSFVYAATLVLFTLANKNTTAANAIFLQDTAPLWVLLLSPWLLGESPTRKDWPFAAAIATGMGLFFVGERDPQATAPNPVLGNWLAAGASITWALVLVGIRRLSLTARPGVDPAAGSAVLGNVLAFGVCLPFMSSLDGATTTDWLAILYLGAIQIGLAYAILTAAAPRLPAFELGLLLLLEPVLNPVWTWLVHGEQPSAIAGMGGGIVLSALVARAWQSAGNDPAAL